MYKRPSTPAEGVGIIRAALLRTVAHKNDESYHILWKSVDLMFNGTWERNMLTRLCELSEVTTFLFHTVCPVVEEMLSTPDKWDANIVEGLRDEKALEHVQEVYGLLEDMRNSAQGALQRSGVDEDVCMCATETLKLFDSPYFCECVRSIALTSLQGRICLRIGLPRMTMTFKNDCALHSEKMNVDVVQSLFVRT